MRILRNGRIKVFVDAKHGETGVLLRGWAKSNDEDAALRDLAKRSALDVD